MDPPSDLEDDDDLPVEDEPTEAELDPHFEEKEDDDLAEVDEENNIFHERNWEEVPVIDHPMIQQRFHLPELAPFIVEPLTHVSGPRNIPANTLTESQYFELFYNEEILANYVAQTNEKVSMQTIRAWEAADNLTIAGLKRFFAVDLYMDVVERKGDINGYWYNSVWGDDYVRELISRDRFLLIRYNLTWTNTANLSAEERSVPVAGSVACGAEERGLMRERADDERARAS